MTDRISLSLVTPPTEYPITLLEAKAAARVDITDDDTFITGLIDSATAWCEAFTQRQFVTATYDWRLPAFPTFFEVPRPELQSVTSITYVDTNGSAQTLSASLYVVEPYGLPGRIRVAYGSSWPSTQPRDSAVTVRFVCGYGAASSVPDGIKTAISMWVSTAYRDRETSRFGTTSTPVPLAIERLLSPFRFSYVEQP